MDDVLGYKGRNAVVTGAASGMGAATASLLIDLGANVTAIDVKPTELAVVASLQVDLRDRSAIDEAVASIADPSTQSSALPDSPAHPSPISTR